MRRRTAWIGLTCSLLGACATQSVRASGGAAGSDLARGPSVAATVGAARTGPSIAPGFMGLSIEYRAISAYTGPNWSALNPVLVRLLRNLAPAQSPSIRIGGNSSDSTWWPMRGVARPGGVKYALTTRWLRTVRAVASAVRARLILGVNLAAGRPALASAEARPMLKLIGRRYVQALEIGNEPDVYGLFPWYHDALGNAHYARGSGYNLSAFIADFSRWRAALPRIALAGPAFAELTDAWSGGLGQFISAEPGLRVLTIHRYPLRACLSDITSPAFASIANLLSDQASSGLAQSVAPLVPVAHARGLALRVDETNSASCSGARNVSNTFASALWVLDALFNFASVGVDGVNLHSLPRARYELFTFTHRRASWQAFVHPEYYGMLMFAKAFPVGARLLPTTVSGTSTGTVGVPVKIWATRARDRRTRVVLINKDASAAHEVDLRVRGTSHATLERLQAPDVGSTLGVTLAGQTFGAVTSTGALRGALHTSRIHRRPGGDYVINVPPTSAALLTQ